MPLKKPAVPPTPCIAANVYKIALFDQLLLDPRTTFARQANMPFKGHAENGRKN